MTAVNIRFKNYLLENTYLQTTETQRDEIIHFWRNERAVIDPMEAERRSREVVFMVRAGSGELAGVCTVGLTQFQNDQIFYAYRMFLRKRDRVPYLMWAVTNAARDFLRNFEHPDLRPAGMIIVTENPKLMRPGMRQSFERHGYLYRGQTPRGLDVWAVDFGDFPFGTSMASVL